MSGWSSAAVRERKANLDFRLPMVVHGHRDFQGDGVRRLERRHFLDIDARLVERRRQTFEPVILQDFRQRVLRLGHLAVFAVLAAFDAEFAVDDEQGRAVRRCVGGGDAAQRIRRRRRQVLPGRQHGGAVFQSEDGVVEQSARAPYDPQGQPRHDAQAPGPGTLAGPVEVCMLVAGVGHHHAAVGQHVLHFHQLVTGEAEAAGRKADASGADETADADGRALAAAGQGESELVQLRVENAETDPGGDVDELPLGVDLELRAGIPRSQSEKGQIDDDLVAAGEPFIGVVSRSDAHAELVRRGRS